MHIWVVDCLYFDFLLGQKLVPIYTHLALLIDWFWIQFQRFSIHMGSAEWWYSLQHWHVLTVFAFLRADQLTTCLTHSAWFFRVLEPLPYIRFPSKQQGWANWDLPRYLWTYYIFTHRVVGSIFFSSFILFSLLLKLIGAEQKIYPNWVEVKFCLEFIKC